MEDIEYIELCDSTENTGSHQGFPHEENSLTTTVKRCRVCNSKAYGFNYEVVSCNACKMFFRRVMVDSLSYQCRVNGNCFDDLDYNSKRPNCKSCRLKKCLEVGMKYTLPDSKFQAPLQQCLVAPTIKPEFSLLSLIKPLLDLDYQREHYFQNIYTEENPSMIHMLSRGTKGYQGPLFSERCVVVLDDQYSFFGVLTSVEFLASLEFMEDLELSDKVILVKNFAMKSSLLANSYQSMAKRFDQMINPNGRDVYPDSVLQLGAFSEVFLNRIRKLLVFKLREINITKEEYILANVILFCNTAHTGLSENGKNLIGSQQKIYCGALLKLCNSTHQQNGPARFNEILSLGDILSQVFQDVQSLLTIFGLYFPNINHRNLIKECFDFA